MAILHRDLRASDHDREQAVALLKAHYAEGRLSRAELAWRSDAAYRAVGLGELDRLTSDLPARAAAAPAPALARAAALAARARARRVARDRAAGGVARAAADLLRARDAGRFLLAPLWIPLLLAFVAYRLIRARVSCR